MDGTLWSTNSWVPAAAGVYTITAVLTDTVNNTATDTITTTIAACATEYTGDNVTDFVSLDATAVQSAVSAADVGDVVKIAGNCAGVQSIDGNDQTVYITQSLSLQGGYNPDAWLASPNHTLTTTLSAQGLGRVIEVAGNISVTLDYLKITDGDDLIGAGIYLNSGAMLTVSNSLVTNNTSARGSGLLAASNTTVIISNTTFSYNQTSGDGGGIFISSGTLTLINSTLHHNEVTSAGGGIFAGATTLTIENSTLSHNQAGSGAAIFIFFIPVGSTTLINNTIVSNTATITDEGSILVGNGLIAHNNLIAYNTFSNCDIGGTILTATYNLDSDGSCGFIGSGNISGANPALGPLADNGGDTWTHLPHTTSQVINAIPAAACIVNSDQRGLSRPQGSGCDMGAVEVAASNPAITPALTISIVDNMVQLDWSQEAANCTYTVYRSSNPYSGFTPWQSNLNTLSITDGDGLSNGYYYYVEATACSGGSTAVSHTVTTFPFALTPGD